MAGICSAAIDWAATGSMLSGWGTLIGSGAVIFAAIKAGDAVTNWKRQKMAERKMEIAERILTASYKAQAALLRVRSPFMWAQEEYAAREKLEENAAFLENNTVERQKRLVVAQAYYTRLSTVREDRLPLDEMKPLAKVLFGDAVEKAIERLDHQFWTVQTYVDEYIDHEEPPSRGDDVEPSGAYQSWRERDKKIKEAMYLTSRSKDDEISIAVKGASDAINAACTPILTEVE